MPGCYFSEAPGSPVSALESFGRFQAIGQTGCSTAAHVIASHPTLDGTTDADLSNWQQPHGSCDTDTGFTAWPSSFIPVAIARDVASGFVGPDHSAGSPFALARGQGLLPVLCGNGALDPSEECDDGNNSDGDGCSAACRSEAAGPGTLASSIVSASRPAPEITPLGTVATATSTL